MGEWTHLSLFSGIGGLDLAAEWAGFKTVGQCEWADYPTMVLEKHWPDVPRWRDIRTLTGESFYERTGLRTVDVISGGFPCQPFSVAGKRRGKEDDRYLWPEMLRVVQELKPRWVVGENVAGIINLALNTVLSDLEALQYETRAFVFPACAVDAPHRRDRVCIVANACCKGLQRREQYGASEEKAWASRSATKCGTDVPDANSKVRTNSVQTRRGGTRPGNIGWWPTEPNVGRMANGVPKRVDRLKCLGNAVVPQQFFPVFDAIMKYETGENHETNSD